MNRALQKLEAVRNRIRVLQAQEVVLEDKIKRQNQRRTRKALRKKLRDPNTRAVFYLMRNIERSLFEP